MSKLYAIRQTKFDKYWYDFVEDFASYELDEHCVSNDFVYVKECRQSLMSVNPAWKDSEIVELGIISDLEAKLAEKDKEIESKSNALKTIIIKCCNNCQDKISFAVEKLEKVKETFTWGKDNGYLTPKNAVNIIDNQIKQLKEMK